MISLFSNYLYLVTLLNFEGVLCIYVLLFHEGQAEYHFAMCFSMLHINKWLSMHYYSWSFVCVTFHVVTWLLSSMVRIVSLMPMFRVLWSQHAMLYFKLIKIVFVHVTSKLFFCYHLPTWGRAGVKVGDAWYVANISIIFDAPCLFYTNCFVFCLHFMAFLCIF
jgi:hypothetical protein